MSSSVSVVLLAAGYGTRLYPLTEDCPKALLPVAEKFMLDWIVDSLSEIPSISKIVLVSNDRFFNAFNDWQSKRGSKFELINDGSSSPEDRLGAIRDLMLGLSRLDNRDDILVLGTDNLFDWSLKEMVSFAKETVPSSTVAVRPVGSLKEASRCAVVELDDKAKLISCVEKPKEPASLIAALCIYYFPASIRQRLDEFINAGKNVDAPGFFIEWLSKKETVYGFMTKGEWFDVGSQESYDQVCRHWKDKYTS